MPVSQKDRLWAAVSQARTAPALDAALSPCNAAGRSKLAKRLLDQAWTQKHFYRTRFSGTPKWQGDQLTTLVELSHYLLPRETWAVPHASGEAWTRREVTYTLLALVQHQFGRAAGKALREAFVANKVKYRPRRKASAAQREALKARQFKSKKINQQIAVLDRALVQLGKEIAKPTTRAALARAIVQPGKRRITFSDE